MFAALPPQAKDGLYLNGCWCIYISWTLVIFYPLRFHPRTHWENGTMPERSMPWRYSIWDGRNPCRRRVRWVADSPWKWMTPLEQMVMAQADLARMVACSVLIYNFTDNILINYQMPLTIRKHRGGMPKAWWWDTRHFTAYHRGDVFGTSVHFHCRRNEGEAVPALPGVSFPSEKQVCDMLYCNNVFGCYFLPLNVLDPCRTVGCGWRIRYLKGRAWVWLKICPQTWFKHI